MSAVQALCLVTLVSRATAVSELERQAARESALQGRESVAAKSNIPPAPDNFFSRAFLESHIESILQFYTPRVHDPSGGFFQNFFDNGTVFDPTYKQIVSSCRMVINFMRAGIISGRDDLIELGRHGRDFVEHVHYVRERDEYSFDVSDGKPADMTQQAYAYAFILSMHASARAAGAAIDDRDVERIFAHLESKFYLGDAQGAYLDTIFANGTVDDIYRGQNSNMHMCEALIAAYEATRNETYLQRAEALAETFTLRMAAKGGGFIWEHYTREWEVDWSYNIDDPTNIYRPWGFQPGHQIEWAKNLLNLNRHNASAWKVETARRLFDGAWNISWDAKFGGLVYGFGPNRSWCDSTKYFWVQAESFASAAQLYNATSDPAYVERFVDLWKYQWQHWVDHEYGAWIAFNMTRDNIPFNKKKAIAGAKCDYHTLVACVEALRAFE